MCVPRCCAAQQPGDSVDETVLWRQDFDGFRPGGPIAADASWRQEASEALETSAARVAEDGTLHVEAGSSTKTPTHAGNYVSRGLRGAGVGEEVLRIRFRLRHGIAPRRWHGKLAGVGVRVAGQWVFELKLWDGVEHATLNGLPFPFPGAGNYHDYALLIDFELDTVTLSVDGGEPHGPFALLGNRDWTVYGVVNAAEAELVWYAALHHTKAGRSHAIQVDDIVVSQQPHRSGLDHLDIDVATVRSLVPGRSLFAAPDDHLRWENGRLPDFDRFVAVADLNRADPLVVTSRLPGLLYAILWRWDFGMLDTDPQSMPTLHGWELVDADAGRVMDFGPPLSPVPLYRRSMGAGRHEVTIGEYLGQWVLVGFEEHSEAGAQIRPLPEITLVGGRTRHNVFDPGANVQVKAARTVLGIRLCRKGEAAQSVSLDSFRAPAEPGRYWLEVNLDSGTRFIPLTVGYGPVSEPGWRTDRLFPIHAYGSGYAQNANPAIVSDLTVLAQLDLGLNTFFVSRGKKAPPPQPELIDAIGGRRFYSTRNFTRYAVRQVEEDDSALRVFFWSLGQFPSAKNVLGYYAEDEPPSETSRRMGLIERKFADDFRGSDLRLLYCLVSGGTEYWQAANTSAGMFRAYPFYKNIVDDVPAMRSYVQRTLIDGIANWRKHAPDRPVWVIVQAFGDPTWEVPSAAQVRLLCNLALARGIDGLTYFSWGHGMPIHGLARWPHVPADERYAEVGRINHRIRALELHR
ncbi:MAG: hypothetical protein ACR2NL_07410, partial [Acidimicrobiia bacterium]